MGQKNRTLLSLAAGALITLTGFGVPPSAWCGPVPGQDRSLQILKSIYDEVKDMGREPGEDVLAREFFIGPDDDDTNKDIHAAVVVQEREDGSDTMSLSFNILKRSAEDRRVKLFGEARTVVVRVRAADVELMKSDCGDKELERLAAGLLQAIRDKKRILRERHNPGPPRA